MPEKYVPKYRAPKRSGFGRSNNSSNSSNSSKASKDSKGPFGEGDFKPARRKEPEEAAPAHSSHVIPREAPPKPAAAAPVEPVAPRTAPKPPARPTARDIEDLFSPDSVAQPAPTRSSEDYFDALVAKRPAEPAPAPLNASPAPTESLKPPVSSPSDESARQAARQESGSTLVDGTFDGTVVKSAIKGGSRSDAWDPFLKDPEPEHRRFSRNNGVTDLEKLTASKELKKKKKPEKLKRPVTSHERQQHQSLAQWFKEILILGLIAILTAVLLTNYVVQAFFIPSESMEDTLVKNDRVLVNKLVYNFRNPEPGDIVVFTSPDKNTVDVPEAGPIGKVMNEAAQGLGLRSSIQDLIKRVIAVEGQTVEVKIGSVFVDGKQIDEPYRKDFLPMPDFPPTKVPEGSVFVMGDNRFQSHDSRAFGPVEVDSVVGRAFALIWPVQRFSLLSSTERKPVQTKG